MIIAVSSTGKTLADTVDPRFGRARYILLVNLDSLAVEPIDNSENINAFKGAGIKAASMLADNGVETLLTGYCGPNAFKTLNAAGINVVNNVSGTVKEAIETFQKGEMVFASEPNADGHW